jgi:hypothetical protein
VYSGNIVDVVDDEAIAVEDVVVVSGNIVDVVDGAAKLRSRF